MIGIAPELFNMRGARSGCRSGSSCGGFASPRGARRALLSGGTQAAGVVILDSKGTGIARAADHRARGESTSEPQGHSAGLFYSSDVRFYVPDDFHQPSRPRHVGSNHPHVIATSRSPSPSMNRSVHSTSSRITASPSAMAASDGESKS